MYKSSTSYSERRVLLFNKDPDNSTVTETLKNMESPLPDNAIYHVKYIYEGIRLHEDWKNMHTSDLTTYQEEIQDSIGESFNAILFVVNKIDLIENELHLHKWKFRSEVVSSAFGILIMGCSVNENKEELIKKIHPGWNKTIKEFAKLGVHCVPYGVDSNLLNNISKQGLELLPTDLFEQPTCSIVSLITRPFQGIFD